MQVWSYGGLPSLHATLTTALTAIIYLQEGATAAFAISLIFTSLVLFDALNLRRFVGEQGQTLNRLIETLPQDEEYKYPILSTRVGHSFIEVAAGAFVGISVAIIGWLVG